jgi:tripartite-type tricarboxylate transporter receptor subunit TctC
MLTLVVLMLVIGLMFVSPVFAEGAKEKPTADWPTKPIQIVVPTAPGGNTDLTGRIAAKYLEKELGKPVVIVNISGASGSVGTRDVIDSNPDGYKLLWFHNTALVINVTGIVDFISYEVLDPICTAVWDNSFGLYVKSDSPLNTLEDLAKEIKNNPGKVTFSSAAGGLSHLLGLSFQDMAGGKFTFIDAGNDAARIVSVLGGHVDVTPSFYSAAQQYVDNGDIKCLGIVAAQRNPLMPDFPTATEQGFNFVFSGLGFNMYAPKGTPTEIAEKISKAMEKISKDPGYIEEMAKIGCVVGYEDTETTNATLRKMYSEYARYKDLFKK